MKREINYTITQREAGMHILDFLKSKGYSHQLITLLKKTNRGIQRNQVWAYVNETLTPGDCLTIIIEETETSKIPPIAHPLSIVYEDEDILVINKDANMPIHPSLHHYENTLANAVMYYLADASFTFRCMNRLDRDTTGLTIVAKNLLAAAVLGQQIKNRTLHRTYLAICSGATSAAGTINAPIARVDGSTIERMVDYEKGEAAITHYRTLSYDADKALSLVELQLETGRTHQIRVHMKHIGHPLIGDFLYHPDMEYMARQALHSCALDFVHPITGQKMHLTSPLPRDMKCLFPSF